MKTIADLRKERGMTQAELAKAAGISQQSVCKLESSSLGGAKWLTVERVAAALGVDSASLMLSAESDRKPPHCHECARLRAHIAKLRAWVDSALVLEMDTDAGDVK